MKVDSDKNKPFESNRAIIKATCSVIKVDFEHNQGRNISISNAGWAMSETSSLPRGPTQADS